MKKITLLTATALTLAGLSGQTLAAQAATGNWNQVSLKGNRVIVTYGSNCDLQDLQSIFDKLGNCFPNITLPDCELPGNNVPDTDAPETDMPDVNLPDTDAPETDIPDVEIPDANFPGTNTPDSNNKPGDDNNTEENLPETETPDNETPDNETSEDSTSHAYIKQVVNLVNTERAKEGLSPLTIDTKVQAAAQVRAVECEQSFSHTRPNGSSFATALKEQNVSYKSAGENIAWGQRSPEEVVNAWMNSSGHRANIMNPNFTTIGVGYYRNARGTNYWCQLFTR